MRARFKNLLFILVAMPILTLTSCKDDDEPCTESTWYQDSDGDGLGNPDVSVSACEQPDGYVSNDDDDDDTGSTGALDCTEYTGYDLVECLANSFLGTLSTSQLEDAQLTYSVSTAQEWSNLPVGNVPRPGIGLEDLSTTQLAAAKALLVAASGETENEGYDEMMQTLNADDYLNNVGGNGYGSGLYYLAILGTPSSSGTWEVMFGGHHYAFGNTYTDGELVAGTPSFRGIEPFGTFTWDGESNQPLNQEQEAFAALLQSFSDSELATAKLSGSWSDILGGPGEDDNFPSTYSGIKVSALSDSQKELVKTAIKTYVLDITDADAVLIYETYVDELDETYVAYSGTTGVETVGDYVRIDGPSVWIEYSVQNGIILSDPHPHSVWRDKGNDYGGN